MMKIRLNSVISSPFDIEINPEEKVESIVKLANEHFTKIGLEVPQEKKAILRGYILDTNKSIKESDIHELDNILLLFKLKREEEPAIKEEKPKHKIVKHHKKEKQIEKEEGKDMEEEIKTLPKDEKEKEEGKETDESEEEEEETDETGETDESEDESDEDEDEEEEEEEEEEVIEEDGEHMPGEFEEFGAEQIERIASIAAHIDWSDFPLPHPEDLEMMVAMGFPKFRCTKALLLNGFNPEAAVEWILLNNDNPGVDDPLTAQQLSQIMMAANVQIVDEKDTLANRMKEAVAKNKCTYTVTGKKYAKQKWFFCYTCGFVDSEGVCEACANVCHKGHSLSEPRGMEAGGSFFCDCGAGETCKCNKT
jgi:hypothetical protein